MIFAIITYYVLPGRQLQSFVLPFVAIFLPLSGIWASSHSPDKDHVNRLPARLAHIEDGQFSPGSGSGKRMFSNATSDTLINSDDGKMQYFKPSEKNLAEVAEIQPVSRQLPMTIVQERTSIGR